MSHTYNLDYMKTNDIRITERIRQLLIYIAYISIINKLIGIFNNLKPYTIGRVYSALTYMMGN